jgi:DNA-binding transcriptional LysR family regulator
MVREDLGDLNAFMTVAEERSFTRAAARLGASQSALSHTIRRLEARLGVRLLTRTTRSVATTQAGNKLLATLAPALTSIGEELASLREMRDKPAGTIRITVSDHAARHVLWPALRRFLPHYPDIHVELSIDAGLADIVSDGFDAGVRLGEALAKDMIAVRISGEQRMAIVASPDYLEGRALPKQPQDIAAHRCINLRMPSAGTLYAWELEKGGREVRVKVDGQIAFNDMSMILGAALDGFGLACVMEDQALPHIGEGRLVRLLKDWCPAFPGYHLYYPSRRQPSAAFALLVEALRHRHR